MASVSKREWEYKGQSKSAWIVRYVDKSGHHRQKTFEKKKDAEAYRARIHSDISLGIPTPGNGAITVKEIAKEFLITRKRMADDGELSRSTYIREDAHLMMHIVPMIGSTKVRDLDTGNVDKFMSDLRQKRVKWKDAALAPSTVKQAVRTLAAVIDYAKRRGHVHQNVVREVSNWNENRMTVRVKIRTFQPDEVRHLMQTIETRRRWQHDRSIALTRGMLYLGAFCGLRFGEIVGLTLDKIDFNRKLILVRHSMDRWNNLKQPKTAAGVRDVPMPPGVEWALLEWVRLANVQPGALVFTTKGGKPMTKEPFHRDIWRAALDAAGLGVDEKGVRFHFHALRHFFASMMIQRRMSLTDTAQLMGHATFDMTLQTYAHPIVDAHWRHSTVAQIALDLIPLQQGSIAQELRIDA